MRVDRTPSGAHLEMIEDWLRRCGTVRETPDGWVVQLSPELLRDYAEWVAAAQREAIAAQKLTMEAQREVIDLLHAQIGRMERQMEELRAAL